MELVIFRFKQEVEPIRQAEILKQIMQWTDLVHDSIASLAGQPNKCWLLVNNDCVEAVLLKLSAISEIEGDFGPAVGSRFDV